MTSLKTLFLKYGQIDNSNLSFAQLSDLSDKLKQMPLDEIQSASDGEQFILLVQKVRKYVKKADTLNGKNYLELINSLLSVGEDGLYSNDLRFIFELIQNVDDCDYENPDDCSLDMRFDFNAGEIVLTYNETGFTPFNVFAITGIAEAAKNITTGKNEIGEKGIGFKSVFGVAKKVRIQSGWFSFELNRSSFTVPVPCYSSHDFVKGTIMTLYMLPKEVENIYNKLKQRYCHKNALFTRNPILFLHKITHLKMYYDSWRSMEFNVSNKYHGLDLGIHRDDDIVISVDLHDSNDGLDNKSHYAESIVCHRYSYPVTFSEEACRSRYGETTLVGKGGGKQMVLQTLVPYEEHLDEIEGGALYSFLPTQISLTVPIICHVPFKLSVSRENIDSQKNNLWFQEAKEYLSDLLDQTYINMSRLIKERVILYLPQADRSIFAASFGAAKMISGLRAFQGAHFLELPIFYTADGSYKTHDEITTIAYDEKIRDPIRAHKLLDLNKPLFLLPEGFPFTSKYGIRTEREVKKKVFLSALRNDMITVEALKFLDDESYSYEDVDIFDNHSFSFSEAQLTQLMLHKKILKLLQELSLDYIKRRERPPFSIHSQSVQLLSEVFDNSFIVEDVPKSVASYLSICGNDCIGLNLEKGAYLPCSNGVVLSSNSYLDSFTAFCYDLDPNDTFSKRQRLRQETQQLNLAINNTDSSPEEFIRDLRNIRLTTIDNLGRKGYENYFKLILKAGTRPIRYLHELLQNADDCAYPTGETPRFRMHITEQTIEVEYNELGFTRKDIISITAIGESTKNSILNNDFSTIGKKGIGFKTVFEIANKVHISSGDYHFLLTSSEPTVPKTFSSEAPYQEGTRMELFLKDSYALNDSFDDKSLLKLCLCLRKLKFIKIGTNDIRIDDTNDNRTITINKKSYVYRKFTHNFEVNNEHALAELDTSDPSSKRNQKITCYVPEESSSNKHFVYVGLPTEHELRIPMSIDAPFELTTSREFIDSDHKYWNGIVRENMYIAIIKVMEQLKQSERDDIFRFVKFLPRFNTYKNDITPAEHDFINEYPFLNMLKKYSIIPTFDLNVFVKPDDPDVRFYPEVITLLLRKKIVSFIDSIPAGSIMDISSKYINEEEPDKPSNITKILGCRDADSHIVSQLVLRYAEQFIDEKEYRDALYSYLLKHHENFDQHDLLALRIIPVIEPRSQNTIYVEWEDDSIFVKRSGTTYDDIYLLNESILPKEKCEQIFNVNINEITPLFIKESYRNSLVEKLHSTDIEKLYQFLIQEYRNGNLRKNEAIGVLLEYKECIPLRNQLGEITDRELFICKESVNYFPVDVINSITVHDECKELAEYIKCADLSSVYYEHFYYKEQLTDEDIEYLSEDYFEHSDEILRGFLSSGQISNDLLSTYNLEYLSMGKSTDESMNYIFPEKSVTDYSILKRHIQRLWNQRLRVVIVNEVQPVHKGETPNGSLFSLDIQDARNGALSMYAVEGETTQHFCQMCHKVKPKSLMEVDNIELNPSYFFPQLRIALCVECSKRFKLLRNNKSVLNSFIDSILTVSIGKSGLVKIPIGEETITFTGTHLAEIQEIMRLKNKE